MTKNNKYILAFFFCLVLALASIHTAFALDIGSDEISNTIKLTSDNPIKIAARIINFFMMFLGIIAVSLVIFAGFKWMTSNGNEENIDAAKKILKNAVIGLVIILSSWGIVTFILGRLISDTSSGGSGGGSNRYGILTGGGALGSCTIQSVYPEPEQKEVPRNTAIIVTFKEDLKLDTVCLDAGGAACACDNTSVCNRLNTNYFKIYEGTGLPGDATSTDAIVNHPVGDNRTLVITPVLPLGSPTNNVWYTTYISNDIQATTGCLNGSVSCGMFDTCGTDYYRWQFEVSNKLDLTPPQMVLGGIFPDPDNIRDVITTNSVLASALGSFKVNGTPQAYIPAQVQSISPTGSSQPVTITLETNYNETTGTNFSITVILGNKAQLQKGTTVLGVADFNGNNVTFPGYFTLVVGGDETYTVGNMWMATISAAQRADTIMVGVDTYTFVNASSSGYNIEIDSNPAQQAINIALALFRTDISAHVDSITVDIESKTGGFAGNSINLSTNNYTTFTVVAMHGGTDSSQVTIVKDKKDKPMNSIIQINFNEAVNPITVSGNTGEVKDTIRVINNDSAAKTNGQSCSQNNECLSFKCDGGSCSGDYIDGRFDISNGYKTLEFRSNNECGINGCGEKIYCLPADGNLQVRLAAASLVDCTVDGDCVAKAPYNSCVDSFGQFKSCQDANGKNHPLSKITPMIGVMDAAFNSLDGNRDENADGPISFYDENVQTNTYKDSYRWSFFINSKIDATPPKIRTIIPNSDGFSVNLSDPVVIEFDKLIMSSTLKSGSLKLTVGTTTIEHKLLNLRNTTNVPTGFWTTNENLDFSPLDGQPDITRAKINHSMFGENIDYSSQVGSGVKDIFQNCFKPSSGPGPSVNCEATQDFPSCCNGIATAAGNCSY